MLLSRINRYPIFIFLTAAGWCRSASAGRVSGDAEHAVFYEKCMSIIVIIITPNGDWNYGYILTTYNTQTHWAGCRN